MEESYKIKLQNIKSYSNNQKHESKYRLFIFIF